MAALAEQDEPNTLSQMKTPPELAATELATRIILSKSAGPLVRFELLKELTTLLQARDKLNAELIACSEACEAATKERDQLRAERDQLKEHDTMMVELSVATMSIAEDDRSLWDIPNGPSCPTIETVKKLRNDFDQLKKENEALKVVARAAHREHYPYETDEPCDICSALTALKEKGVILL